MKLWKPPKMSFETLDVYDDVWVPGKIWKSLKKLIVNSSSFLNFQNANSLAFECGDNVQNKLIERTEWLVTY